MLSFTRHFQDRTDQISVTPETLIVAGWTGRDEAALRHHIEELAAIGVPRPSSVPVFYRNAVNNVMQTRRLEVLGPDTSGEVEPVIVALADGLWIGLGSDHTDRKAETIGVSLSKQMCAKPIAATAWRYDDVRAHWDQLMLRSDVRRGGERQLYQEGFVASMRTPDELIKLYTRDATLPVGTAMFCGTLAVHGNIAFADRFEMELNDPVLGRTISHAYTISTLPDEG
jgi:hypothetical protein